MSKPGKKPVEEVSFQQVLDALVDAENIFPAGYIHKLSDLDKKEEQKVQNIWSQIPLERRRALLEDMDDFSSSDFLLNFSPVAHLALGDVDGKVRAASVRILGSDEEPANAPIFFELLENDPDEAVRAAAALSFSPLVYAGEIEEIPAALLEKIENALLKKMDSDDTEEVRRRALEALGYSSRPELPDLILAAFQKGSQNWMVSALFAMGHSSNKEWLSEIEAGLQDQRPLVRAEAAEAAGELELPEVVPALLDLLVDASSEVRAACIWSLSQIGGDGVREALETMIDESADEVELDLLEEALENLDFNEEFIPMLLDLDNLDDDDDFFMLDDEEEPSDEPDNGKTKRPD